MILQFVHDLYSKQVPTPNANKQQLIPRKVADSISTWFGNQPIIYKHKEKSYS